MKTPSMIKKPQYIYNKEITINIW